MRIHISSRILNYGLASTAASSHILVFGPSTFIHTTTPYVAISFMESASESSFCEHIPVATTELLRNVPAKSSGIMPQVLVQHFQSVNVVVGIRLTETLTQPT